MPFWFYSESLISITASSVDWKLSASNTASPVTVSGVQVGSTGRVAIAIAGVCGGAITGVTVAGANATAITATQGGLRGAGVFYADVATTIADVVVTISGSFNTIAVGAYAVGIGGTFQGYSANSASTYSTSFNVPAGSAVIGCATQFNNPAPSVTWTGISQDNFQTFLTSFNVVGDAHTNYTAAATGQVVSAQFSAGSTGAAAFAVFSP